MFATIRRKWNAFKVDCKEYQSLCREVSCARHKLDAVRGKITVLYGIGDAVKGQYCIKRKWVGVPSLNRVAEFGGRRAGVVVPRDTYCQYFKSDIYGKNADVCSQTDCSCYAGNCDYVAAAKELMVVCEKRRMFWNRKNKINIK